MPIIIEIHNSKFRYKIKQHFIPIKYSTNALSISFSKTEFKNSNNLTNCFFYINDSLKK